MDYRREHGIRQPDLVTRRRCAAALIAFLTLLTGACRDSSSPDKGVEIAVAVTSLDGPTIALSSDNRITVSCSVALEAVATGVGATTWQAGTLRFYAGRDRSEALDTLRLSVEQAGSFWDGTRIEAGETQNGRLVASASIPFAVTAEFEYRPTPRAATRTVEASFTCGPTVPDGAAGPAITAVRVHPASGAVEPGQTIRIEYSATSEIGLVQSLVEVSGACEASDTTAIRLEKTVSDSVYIALPRTCVVGAPLMVRVTVFDGALEAAFHEVGPVLFVADLTPPTVTPSFVPRVDPNGTAHPEADYFVGDTLHVFFNAVDNVGIAALVWEVSPSGVRDSIPVVSAGTNLIKIPVDASWGADPVRLRLYAWDRAGFMSNVYTSPHEIRIHPTIVRPVRSTSVSGGIDELAIDSDRGIAYFMQVENQRIAIFSLATMSVTGYVNLATHLGDLDLTPTGDSLIVTMPAQGALGIIDLSGASPVVSTFPLTILDPVVKDVPVRVRVLGVGRVLVGLEGTAQPSRRVTEVNLGTKSQRILPEPPYAGGGVFERSHDRSTVVFRGLMDHLQRYDAIIDQFGPTRPVPPMWYQIRPSVDAHGERIAFGMDVFDRALLLVSRATRMPGHVYQPTAISPSGEFLYAGSYKDGLVRYRASDGSIIDRTPNPVRADVIRVTSDGKWVITHGVGGISVIDMR